LRIFTVSLKLDGRGRR